jgi:ribosomal protein S17
MWKSIEYAWYLSVITFIRYVVSQKNGKTKLFVFPFFWLVTYPMKVITERYQAHSIDFHIMCLSILLTCSVPNEGYYRKVSMERQIMWKSIEYAWYLSVITFIRYVVSQKNGKTNNVKVNWVCLIQRYQAHSIDFHIICLSILLTYNVPNEGYYRKVSSTLNWLSHYLSFHSFVITFIRYVVSQKNGKTNNVKVNWVCLIPFCNNLH